MQFAFFFFSSHTKSKEYKHRLKLKTMTMVSRTASECLGSPLELAFQVKVPCLTHYEETAQGLRACTALTEELSPVSET